MAKLKIYTFPDIVLAQKASAVQRVEKELRPFAENMLETMYDAPGIGLAANQVGSLQRLIVVDTEYDIEDDPSGEGKPGVAVIRRKDPTVLINPEIIRKEGSTVFEEACLSVPEYFAEVKRSEKIVVRYQDLDGLAHELKADGLLAICIQHEIDHLEGKLFIDRLSPLKKEMARKKLRTERQRRDSGDIDALLTSRDTHSASNKTGNKKKGF